MCLFCVSWYKCQALPLPSKYIEKFESTIFTFLWRGKLEKLEKYETKNELKFGGLAVPCIASKADALFVRQTCRLLNNKENNSRKHIQFWIGGLFSHLWPDMGQGPHSRIVPEYFEHLRTLIEEAVRMEVIDKNNLKCTSAKFIYKEYTSTFPPPKVIYKHELPWNMVFKRLWDPVLDPPVQSLMFLLVHNILPVRARLKRLNMVNSDKCLEDDLVADVEHVFCHCLRTREGWQWIRWKILTDLIPNTFQIPSDFEFLHLCFESPNEKEIVWLIGSYVCLAWDFLHKSAGHLNVDRMKSELHQLYRQNQTGQNKLQNLHF